MRLTCTSNSESGSTRDRGRLRNHAGESFLVGALDGAELLPECAVVRAWFQLSEPFEVGNPRVADGPGDESGQERIGLHQPAARRDAVRLVVEAFRPEGVEVPGQRRLDEAAVQRRHAVDGMAADDAQVRHAHLFWIPFLDERHPLQTPVVAGPDGGDVCQEAPIDLVDDLQVPRHDALEQGHGPLLERLRQQRVIRVPHRRLRHLPRGVPGQVSLVDEDAHQLGDGQRRMRVVQVNGDLRRKGVEGLVIPLVPGDEISHRAGDQEVLLEEAQLLPRRHGVGRVQDLRDGLRGDLLFHRLQIVAGVEDLHVEVA